MTSTDNCSVICLCRMILQTIVDICGQNASRIWFQILSTIFWPFKKKIFIKSIFFWFLTFLTLTSTDNCSVICLCGMIISTLWLADNFRTYVTCHMLHVSDLSHIRCHMSHGMCDTVRLFTYMYFGSVNQIYLIFLESLWLADHFRMYVTCHML